MMKIIWSITGYQNKGSWVPFILILIIAYIGNVTAAPRSVREEGAKDVCEEVIPRLKNLQKNIIYSALRLNLLITEDDRIKFTDQVGEALEPILKAAATKKDASLVESVVDVIGKETSKFFPLTGGAISSVAKPIIKTGTEGLLNGMCKSTGCCLS